MAKWKEETTIKFLELYKRHETLWDKNSETYRKKEDRQLAMEAIIKEFNLPNFGVKELKAKIKILRSTYLNEVHKIAYSVQKNGYKRKPTLKWFGIMSSMVKKSQKKNQPRKNPEVLDGESMSFDHFTSESNASDEVSFQWILYITLKKRSPI